MKNTQFAQRCIEIATRYRTLYVKDCVGSPMTAEIKKRFLNHIFADRNRILKATANTFGFDCSTLIKAVLWGWCGDTSDTYGGAKYASNGVPDMSADSMIAECRDLSTDFNNIEVGEILWCPTHTGVYIGDGLAVEATSRWTHNVQITAVGNIGEKEGYNTRMWVKHGKSPYIDYGEEKEAEAVEPVEKAVKKSRKAKKVETETIEE